jgi:hypothetical protein
MESKTFNHIVKLILLSINHLLQVTTNNIHEVHNINFSWHFQRFWRIPVDNAHIPLT